MARKTGETLRGPQKGAQGVVMGSTREHVERSWAAVGVDSSMSSIAAVAVGFDAKLDKRVGPFHEEIRWQPDTDYFQRLGDASRGHRLIQDLLKRMWVLDPSRVWICFEEPFFFGAAKANVGSYMKQQAEVAGALKGGLVAFGYTNLVEINNSQWYAVLRRDGVEFEKAPKGATSGERAAIKLANKFRVREWAIQAFGMPELPDLVASKTGAKILRPSSGYGANAKAVQPHDCYDAAGVLAWLLDDLEERGVIE